jgi:NAD-dependent dihydropyrimidine dehydrogenase PreA subunit
MPKRRDTVKNDKKKTQRREFLCNTGKALAGLGVVAGGGNLLAKDPKKEKAAMAAKAATSFPTADYDWTKHRWAYGIDATKCIGCLRCVEACKAENDVIGGANNFRTWVERYFYL